MSTDRASKCHHILVPPDACLIQFSAGDRMAYATPLGVSARGDELWAHCDAAGRILEIELLSDDKPCQADEGIRPPLAAVKSLG